MENQKIINTYEQYTQYEQCNITSSHIKDFIIREIYNNNNNNIAWGKIKSIKLLEYVISYYNYILNYSKDEINDIAKYLEIKEINYPDFKKYSMTYPTIYIHIKNYIYEISICSKIISIYMEYPFHSPYYYEIYMYRMEMLDMKLGITCDISFMLNNNIYNYNNIEKLKKKAGYYNISLYNIFYGIPVAIFTIHSIRNRRKNKYYLPIELINMIYYDYFKDLDV